MRLPEMIKCMTEITDVEQDHYGEPEEKFDKLLNQIMMAYSSDYSSNSHFFGQSIR